MSSRLSVHVQEPGPKRPARRSGTFSARRDRARSSSLLSTITSPTWTPTPHCPQDEAGGIGTVAAALGWMPCVIPDVRIRLARPDDLPELQRIEREAGTRFRGLGLLDHLLDRTLSLSELAQHQRAERIWVADGENGKPIGFAVANVLDGLAHLEELDVVPEAGGQGIGTTLVGTAVTGPRPTGSRPSPSRPSATFPGTRPSTPGSASAAGREAFSPALRGIAHGRHSSASR